RSRRAAAWVGRPGGSKIVHDLYYDQGTKARQDRARYDARDSHCGSGKRARDLVSADAATVKSIMPSGIVMPSGIKSRAEVIIVGGGIVGCSIAYHLAKRGVGDVVLLERRSLTSGTTWHAAGLVGQLRATLNLTRLAQYTAELYRGLGAETGQSTGFMQRG